MSNFNHGKSTETLCRGGKSRRKGNEGRAATELAEAFGADRVTKPIADNVKLLIDPPPMLGDGLVRLMKNGTR